MNKILYFTAVWCTPCKLLGPTMSEVSEHITVDKIDIDESTNTHLLAQYNVKSVPTIILINENGDELDRKVGVQRKDAYIEMINKFK